jgi:hypothetical protein
VLGVLLMLMLVLDDYRVVVFHDLAYCSYSSIQKKFE